MNIVVKPMKILADIFNNGILNSECPFSDSWLLLSKMCNESSLVTTITKCCQNGMNKQNDDSNNQLKQEKDYIESFFRNYILSLNIFIQTIHSNKYKVSDNNNSDDDMKDRQDSSKQEENAGENKDTMQNTLFSLLKIE